MIRRQQMKVEKKKCGTRTSMVENISTDQSVLRIIYTKCNEQKIIQKNHIKSEG